MLGGVRRLVGQLEQLGLLRRVQGERRDAAGERRPLAVGPERSDVLRDAVEHQLGVLGRGVKLFQRPAGFIDQIIARIGGHD